MPEATCAGTVLASRDQFAIKLGIPESRLADFFTAVATFTGGATGTALLSYLTWLASLGPAGQVLVWLGVVTAPAVLWPAAVGGVVLAGGVYGTQKIRRLYSSVTSLEGKRSFSSPLSDLALAVADVVFLPLTILARVDGEMQAAELQRISQFMEQWGYDKEFIQAYLKSSLDDDINVSMDRFANLLQEISKGKKSKFLRDVCIKRMKHQVLAMGREVMEADGKLDIREQILLDHYKNL